MWSIESTPELEQWLWTLDTGQQGQVLAVVALLRERGPSLGRPSVDTLAGSQIPNLKELRTGTLRVLFAFDPRRVGILLVGGDKRGNWTQWYRETIPVAEALWRRHLEAIGGE